MNPPEQDGASASPENDAEKLAVTRRELDRLIKLRNDVANGLLEVSAAAKRDAERLLASSDGAAAPTAAISSSSASWPLGLLLGAFAVGLACGFTVAVLMEPSGTPVAAPQALESLDAPAPPPAQTDIEPAPSEAELPEPAPAASVEQSPRTQPERSVTGQVPAPSTEGGLVLVLSTHRECWLSASVDGGSPSERTIVANQTVVLRVQEEAQITIGNAAACILSINERQTKPLGRDGQVRKIRITPDNFESFFATAP